MKRAAGLVAFYVLVLLSSFVPAALIPVRDEMAFLGMGEKIFFLTYLYLPLNIAAVSIALNRIGPLTGFWVGVIHALTTYALPMLLTDRPVEVSFSSGIAVVLLSIPTIYANLPFVRRLFRGGSTTTPVHGVAGTTIAALETSHGSLGGLGSIAPLGRKLRRLFRQWSEVRIDPSSLASPARRLPRSFLLSVALHDRRALAWICATLALLGGWTLSGEGILDVWPLARTGKEAIGRVVACPAVRPLKFTHLMLTSHTKSWERYRYVIDKTAYEGVAGSSLPCKVGQERLVIYLPQRPAISRLSDHIPPHWLPPFVLVLLIAISLRLTWAGAVEFVQIARLLRHGELICARTTPDGPVLPGTGRRRSLVGFAELPARDGLRRVAVEIPEPRDRTVSLFPLLIEPSGRAMLWSCINPQPLLGADGHLLPVSLKALRWRFLLPVATLAAAVFFVSGLA